MSTTTRPELSRKSKYYLDRHRYYELKHFCLQYPNWRRLYNSTDSLSKGGGDISVKKSGHSNPTAKEGELKAYYSSRMDMIERAAKETDADLWRYILKAVTRGLSYDNLKVTDKIPCCKDVYYELYRKFFWILSRERQ